MSACAHLYDGWVRRAFFKKICIFPRINEATGAILNLRTTLMKHPRRSFLKKLGMAAAAASPLGQALARESRTYQPLPVVVKRDPTAKPLKVALIGAGGMGTYDTSVALEHDNVSLVAVCDLYQGRLRDARERWGEELFLTEDYQEVLRREDVDVVIIGTSDHWHKPISVAALEAGKHVYCEKPMVHSVEEGHEVIDAWKKSGKVFMVGSQGMSSAGNAKARELLAAGAIGKLNYAEGFWARHSPLGAWQYPIPPDASEATVAWDRYLANTAKRPFDANRFFRWRNYTDYGTGMSGDLFVHLFSSLHFITGSLGPEEIGAMGGLRYWQDGREVPDVLVGMFQYPETQAHPGFNLSLRCNFVDGTSGTTYLRLVGSEGAMDVKWEEVVLKQNDVPPDNDPFSQAKNKDAAAFQPKREGMYPVAETVYRVEADYPGTHYLHFQHLFRAIREGGKVDEDPVFGFRAAAPALLCNESYAQNRIIHWDPVKMKKA